MGATKRDATGGAVDAAACDAAAASSPPPPPPLSPLLLEGITETPLPPPLQAWVSSLPGDVKHVLNQLKEAGGEAWLVGGCVRDVMSGRAPREVDVCTTLPADAVARAFPDASGAHRGTGDAFGTMSVRRGSVVLEVTTIRTEGRYSDGRRPDAVSVASRLVDDLARRDFTVNAAAIDVARGMLLDPFGGALDAEKGVLKCVGDPARRLKDDGLRVWRAYRFADAGARGLRSLDADLLAALESSEIQEAARRVSRERIWEELAKILVGQNADKVLELMASHGALAAAVLPPARLKSSSAAADSSGHLLSPSSRGVRAQAHLLPAWRRFHERARRAGGISPHTGVGVVGGGGEGGRASRRSKATANDGENDEKPQQPGSPPPPTPAPPRFVLALDLEATCDAPKSPQPQEVIEVGAVLLDGRRGCRPAETPLAEFHSHVRPTIRPKLSDFCVDFTGVTQEQVDMAPTLDEVLVKMGAWLVEQGALRSAIDDGAVDDDDDDDESEEVDLSPSSSTARRRLLTVTVGDWDLLTLVPRQLEAMNSAAASASAEKKNKEEGEDGEEEKTSTILSPPPWLRAWCDVQVLYREHYLRPRCGLLQMLCDLGLPLEGRPHAALADARALASLLARAVGGDGAAAEVTRSLDGGVSAYGGDAPDMAVARLALLLAPESSGGGESSTSSSSSSATAEAAAVAAAKALKLGRHETRRVGKAAAALGRLPNATSGSDPGAMRLFRAAMGNQLSLQLLLEATLAETDAEGSGDEGKAPSSCSGAASRIDAFIDEWRRLPPLAGGPAPLLDGAALMSATGLKPGGRLGRLKEWLWRLQIERDLSSVEEVRALLEDELPWREGEGEREVGGVMVGSDFNSWPRLEW